MPIGALRLINPPGHRFRRPAPGYVGGYSAYRRPYPQYNPWSSRDPLGVGASLRVDRKRRAKKKTASPSVRRNPVIKRRKKVAKRKMPPRYNSGPNKGRFMSKRAVAAKRARAKTKRNAGVSHRAPSRLPFGRTARAVKSKRRKLARTSPRAAVKLADKRRRAKRKLHREDARYLLQRRRLNEKRKARRATTSTRSNPMAVRRRRRRVRRNSFISTAAKQAKRHHTSPKRRAAAKKAAKTRAAKHAKRSAAAKKAARTRKRHAGVVQRPRKRKTSRKPRRGTKAYFSYIGKKGAAARKRKHRTRKVATSRPRRRVRRRSRVITVTPRRRRTVYFKKTKGGPRYKRHLGVRRHKNRAGRRVMGLRVLRNPGVSDFKNILLTGAGVFAGVLGMRVLSNAFKLYVLPKIYTPTATTSATTTKLLGLLPAGVAFIAAAFSGKFIKNPKVVSAVQVGATLGLLDAVWTSFVKPSIPAGTAQQLLAGVDDMGIQGYGRFSGYGRVGEYLPQQTRPLAGYGLDVHEAMALDEYVPAQGAYGMQVEEALSGSEVEGIQRGYAAGSLSRTSLSS